MKKSLELLNTLIAELDSQLTEAPCAKKVSSTPTSLQPAVASENDFNVNALDLRVGLIVKVSRHETADKLYCEEIDVGEDVPRQIASGLVPHYSLEEMANRRCIVVCNLAPRKLVGFKSHGMVLCAAKKLDDGTEKVEFVDVPATARVGDRVHGLNLSGEAFTVKQCDKRKVFENIAPGLAVTAEGVAVWNNIPLVAGPENDACTAPTLRNAVVR